MAFIKSCSIDSRNEQSPTCEVVHETNKAHFRNLLPNRFLPSSVGKALAWRSGVPGFNPHWGQFLTKFFCSSLCKDLSDNLTETPIVKNWKVLHLAIYMHFVSVCLCFLFKNMVLYFTVYLSCNVWYFTFTFLIVIFFLRFSIYDYSIIFYNMFNLYIWWCFSMNLYFYTESQKRDILLIRIPVLFIQRFTNKF